MPVEQISMQCMIEGCNQAANNIVAHILSAMLEYMSQLYMCTILVSTKEHTSAIHLTHMLA